MRCLENSFYEFAFIPVYELIICKCMCLIQEHKQAQVHSSASEHQSSEKSVPHAVSLDGAHAEEDHDARGPDEVLQVKHSIPADTKIGSQQGTQQELDEELRGLAAQAAGHLAEQAGQAHQEKEAQAKDDVKEASSQPDTEPADSHMKADSSQPETGSAASADVKVAPAQLATEASASDKILEAMKGTSKDEIQKQWVNCFICLE